MCYLMQKHNNNGFGFAVRYLENTLILSQSFPNSSEAFKRFWAFNPNSSSSQKTEELSTCQDLVYVYVAKFKGGQGLSFF